MLKKNRILPEGYTMGFSNPTAVIAWGTKKKKKYGYEKGAKYEFY